MKLADRIDRIEASKTLQVKEKALRLREQGIQVIDLTAGEPDFRTPENIARAGIRAIEEGFTHYTANSGIPELRRSIAEKLKKDNGLEYRPEQIVVSNGAKQSVLNALFAVVGPGDEVLVPAPYWVSYPEQIKIADAEPIIVDTSATGFKLTPRLLEKHLSGRTRAIILNSPCNPTGVVYSASELEALAAILSPRDIWIISDEIYEKIIFDGLRHVSIASLGNLLEKSIVINGFSKSYAMTGWRVGYAAAPLPVAKAMAKIQSHYTSNASSISQKAALEALNGSQASVEYMRNEFEKRRNYIREKLSEHSFLSFVNPQGAFYFFINVSRVYGCRCESGPIENSLDFATYLAEKYHLVTVPGAAFGADAYIRLSFANSMEQIELGIERLLEAMSAMLKQKQGS